MSMLPELPNQIINSLFNLDQGEHQEKYCRNCDRITEQVKISFSDLPGLRDYEVERLLGRVLDFVPGIKLLAGRPSACRCGAVNR
ncbi:hypothetical protein [Kutzneria sp. NPDC052558]|uniref:hypothetical protein n=1 Tax=Kutzneria sp. NPDC052558 TaxID=3364121 RepID=UPI0037C7151D